MIYWRELGLLKEGGTIFFLEEKLQVCGLDAAAVRREVKGSDKVEVYGVLKDAGTMFSGRKYAWLWAGRGCCKEELEGLARAWEGER